ncbi:MAG: hypothetical protein U0264_10395 [Candidatus Kapaibacterium sp.]
MDATLAIDTKMQFFKYLENSILDIDGGNIRAKLWFCGIEPGIPINFSEEYFKKEILSKKTIYSVDDFRDESFQVPYYTGNIYGYPFDKKVGKVLKGWIGIDYIDSYEQNAPVFKLNLFPLPAAHISSWNEFNKKMSGCTLKSEYYGRCISHRFPLLRELVINYDPTVIVCIGRGFIKEFKFAFWGDTEVDVPGMPKQLRNNEIYPQIHVHRKQGFPTIIETPFFGWRKFQLNLDCDAILLGEYIGKQLLEYPDKPKFVN